MDTFRKCVYDTLNGSLIEEYRIPGVENAFEPGSYCEGLYADMLDAYARLSKRFGFIDEDYDIEIIINSLLDIGQYMSLKMFDYGLYFGSQQDNKQLDDTSTKKTNLCLVKKDS